MAAERRRGLLPSIFLGGAVYVFIFLPDVRSDVLGFCAQLFVILIGVPSLAAVLVLTLTYVTTVCVRPNTLGPIDWFTLAWLQALLAALFALLASPLTNELALLCGMETVWIGYVPAVPNVTLPVVRIDSVCSGVNATIAECLASGLHLEALPVQLGGFDVSFGYEWYTLGALIGGGSTLIFLSHLVLSTLLLGIFCSTPTLWRFTATLDDDERMAELLDFVGSACATQRDKYGFGMALRGAWAVRNPTLEAAFDEVTAEMDALAKPSNVHRFFHGTRRDSASAITQDGFRLPAWHGMFGRGVYFADCPLKSLQYTGWGVGWRYMLVCDVELGRTLVEDGGARPDLDPEGGVAITAAGSEAPWAALLPQQEQPAYDSVSVPASALGVRVPEYVIYGGRQAVPRYILAVQQVAAGHEDEQRRVINWLKAKANRALGESCSLSRGVALAEGGVGGGTGFGWAGELCP